MAFALTQKSGPGTATGGVLSVAQAYDSNNTAGNLLVACFRTVTADNTITYSYADTQLNTWQEATSLYTSDVNGGNYIIYAMNCAAGANTLTVTASNFISTFVLEVFEYSGGATTSALDSVSPGGHQSVAVDNTFDPGNLTTSASGELLITSATIDYGFHTTSGPPATAGSGFTVEVDANSISRPNLAVQDNLASGSGSVSMAFGSAGFVWSAVGASFKLAGGGGGATLSTSFLQVGQGFA